MSKSNGGGASGSGGRSGEYRGGGLYRGMSDRAMVGILTSNAFSKSEVSLHKPFAKDIKRNGLKLKSIQTTTSGAWGGKVQKITQYTYEKK